MHEGGAAKLARDKLYFQVVSAIGLLTVEERQGNGLDLAATVPNRMKLLAVNLQTVDQVPYTFRFPSPPLSSCVCGLWQQHRSAIREGLNAMLAKPLSADDPEHQNILATLGLPAAPPGAYAQAISTQHPIRAGVEGPFVLCPKSADPHDPKSSLHLHESQAQSDFVDNFLAFLPRFQAGAAGMDFNAPPYLTRAKGVNLFNDLYCWLYFHVFAAGQKMGWLIPASDWTLDQIFDRRVLDSNGSPSDKYMLSHTLVARWDFYIYTAIYASQPLITGKRDFFERQYCFYAKLDGKEGRVNWRDALKTKLKLYLERFPSCIKGSGKRRRASAMRGEEVEGRRDEPNQKEMALLSEDLDLV